MSGIGEASLVLGVISSIISIIDATKKIYDAAHDINGLPKAFRDVAGKLPLILELVKGAEQFVKRPDVNQDACKALETILEPCRRRMTEVQAIFDKVIPKKGGSIVNRYLKAGRIIGKSDQVETLIGGILKDLNLLSHYFVLPAVTKRELTIAIKEEKAVDSSSQLDDQILNSLHIRVCSSKSDNIKAPHPNTCEWIWRDESNGGTNLIDWLQTAEEASEDRLIFWINGKPGAGKSTLMKYIRDNLSDRMSASWKRTNQTFHFFFSKKKEKESEIVDFLNSTLYQLCNGNRTLIPCIYDIYKIRRDGTSQEYIWDADSLQKALITVSKQTTSSGTCFLFIDGLDECSGDQRELVMCMKNLVCAFQYQMLKLKICAASRPETAFISRLQKYPGLKYQDRTKSDIYKYTYDELTEAAGILELEAEEYILLSQLVEDIANRSQGVFIWVKLVIKEIIAQIDAGQKISQLPHIWACPPFGHPRLRTGSPWVGSEGSGPDPRGPTGRVGF